jgi:F-type H+-transporting ATPase subunit delta
VVRCDALILPFFSAFLLLFGRDFLVSGGFATVHPNNKLTINAIEAAPLEDFSPEVRPSHVLRTLNLNHVHPQAVRANLQEVQKVLGGSGSEEDKAEARIEADVYESLQHALGTK